MIDSLRIRSPRRLPPVRPIAAGSPRPLVCLSGEELHRSAIPDLRELIRRRLDLGAIDAGAAHRPEPLDTSIPFKDVPEFRLDGLPIGPVRWPESSLLPLPVLAAGSVTLRRYAPILGPLSSTGGPVIELTSAPLATEEAHSAVRLSQGSYGTFTNEITLSRPYRGSFVSGFLGSSKSDGRQLWGRQRGQTLGTRVVHPLGDGWVTVGLDDVSYRSWLLATKKGYWDRTAWILRYERPDSSGIRLESSFQWLWLRAGWATSAGLTERRGRSLGFHGRAERSGAGGTLAGVVEADFSRVHYLRTESERRLLEDLSLGAALGWEIEREHVATRASFGLVRLAPVEASPVFSVETDVRASGLPRLTTHASRAVRNRTLPRLPTDGEAWIRQGIDLASERIGEQPEALWRGGVEVGWDAEGVGESTRLVFGVDHLHARQTYEGSVDDLRLIGTVDWDPPAASQQRRGRAYSMARARLRHTLPYGLRIEGSTSGAVADDGVEKDLGLPAIRWKAAISWSGALFRRDLGLDLTLGAWGRSEVATAYGTVRAVEMLESEARASIGNATLFLLIENLANVKRDAPSFDGQFMPYPLRNYRMGLCWVFVD